MNVETRHTEFLSYRIPGLVCTECGSLIAYYECRKDFGDWAEIVLKIMKSTDGGESWKEVKRIVSENDTLNNPVVFSNGNTLHMLYCLNYRRVFHIFSTDDGENWSEAKEITDVFESVDRPFTVVAIGPGHGIVTPAGTLVAPVWYAYDKDDPKAHKPSFVCTVYSKDNGQTWNMGEFPDFNILINPSECALTVLNDGSVMISVRSDSAERLRCHAKSPDGYSNWHEIGFDSRFPDPVCQGSMCYGGGKNFYINCASQTARENLTVKVTDDDFKTFDEIHIADRGGYSDIAYNDGFLYVLYEYDEPENPWHFSMDIEKIKV